VPYYDNPAGRLHELLRQLSDQNPKGSLLEAWATVLGVAEQDVVLHMGGVADLVRQIQEAVDHVGDTNLQAPVARLRDTWARTIFPPDQPLRAKLETVLPGREPLETLALVAGQLRFRAPEGEVPNAEELDRLKDQVRDLVDATRESNELPDGVKQAIADRLVDVLKAIENVHVGGPEAVRRALEAVVGTVARTADPTIAKSSITRRVLMGLGVVWVAFTSGPAIQNSLEAWNTIVPEIAAGDVIQGQDERDEGVDHLGGNRVAPNPPGP